MIKPSGIEHSIRPLTREKYEEAIAKYLAKVKGYPHVRAVYQIGSIGHPGISDVDLVVVVDRVRDPHGLSTLSVYQGESHDSPTRYIFPHDVYLFDTASFLDFRYSVYADNLSLLYGEPQSESSRSPEEERWLSLQILFDFTVLRLAQFRNLFSSGTLDARGILVRVASIKHSSRMLRTLGIECPTVQDFARRVAAARDRYTDVSPHDLIKLFEESFLRFAEVAEAASAYFDQHVLLYYSEVDPGSVLKINRHQILRFVDHAVERNRASTDPFAVFYPKVAFFHYLAFRWCDNVIGRAAARHLAHAGDEVFEMKPEYESILRRRLQAISHHHSFLLENRLSFAMKGIPGFVYSGRAEHGVSLQLPRADYGLVPEVLRRSA